MHVSSVPFCILGSTLLRHESLERHLFWTACKQIDFSVWNGVPSKQSSRPPQKKTWRRQSSMIWKSMQLNLPMCSHKSLFASLNAEALKLNFRYSMQLRKFEAKCGERFWTVKSFLVQFALTLLFGTLRWIPSIPTTATSISLLSWLLG